MKVISTSIADVLILEPKVFGDTRGFFLESFNSCAFGQATGLHVNLVRDNHSRSVWGVLVRVVRGSVFDVVVNIRKTSPSFGQWVGVELSEANQCQLWVPPGLAHGFLVTSDIIDFLYKTTDYYAREHERCLAFIDPAIGMKWPIEDVQPLLFIKDAAGSLLKDLFD